MPGPVFYQAGVPGREPVAGEISGAYGGGAFGLGRQQLRQGFYSWDSAWLWAAWPLPPASELWALVLGVGTLALLCRLFLQGGMGRRAAGAGVHCFGGASGCSLRPFGIPAIPCPIPSAARGSWWPSMTRRAAFAHLSGSAPGPWQGPGGPPRPGSGGEMPPHSLPGCGAGGLLLAVQCDQVTIGGKPAGPLVAFAPDRLSAAGGVRGFDRRGTVCINFG